MRAKKAVVAGHICLDITPVFPANAHTPDIGRLLRPGKLVHMDGVSVHTGGCVANTGLAMKILGADVRLLAKVGDDAFGRMVRVLFDEYEAGGDLLEEKGGTTSYSVVLAPPGIDRVFLHCPGANDTFRAEDVLKFIPEEKGTFHGETKSQAFDQVPSGRAAIAGAAAEAANPLRGASLFHFGYPTLMKRMYTDNGTELERLLRAVKSAGIATSLDLAAVDPDSEAMGAFVLDPDVIKAEMYSGPMFPGWSGVAAGFFFCLFLLLGLGFRCTALPGRWRRRAKIRKTNGERAL